MGRVGPQFSGRAQAGPGLGRRPRILHCKITKNSISGRARAKKIRGLQDLCPRPCSKVRGQAEPGPGQRAGSGRPKNDVDQTCGAHMSYPPPTSPFSLPSLPVAAVLHSRGATSAIACSTPTESHADTAPAWVSAALPRSTASSCSDLNRLHHTHLPTNHSRCFLDRHACPVGGDIRRCPLLAWCLGSKWRGWQMWWRWPREDKMLKLLV
jgi:hypothetical protein